MNKLFFLIFFGLSTLTANAQFFYDEVFTTVNDKKDVRPHYKKYFQVYNTLSPEEVEKITAQSISDFQGDNALLALPRVITKDEFKILQSGTEQRARAIQAFLKDYYSRGDFYIRNQIIPKEVVDSALFRNNELKYKMILKKNDFNFWYGPDVIRDVTGTFRVVEDNLGYIGGMGDLIRARESLMKNIPQYKEALKGLNNPALFYEEMLNRYTKIANEKKGIPLLIMYEENVSADNEDKRIKNLFSKHGIETYYYFHASGNSKKSLIIRNNELFLQSVEGRKTNLQKVSHVILDMEPSDFAPINSKNKLHGFWKLVGEGKISVTNSVGTEFVNDKGIYPYVEKMIEGYLHENPILKNIETSFGATISSKGIQLNENLIQEVRKNPQDWVIKGVMGRGGDSVYIGKKMTPLEVEQVLLNVIKNPAAYIFQKYTHLSVLDNHIVDLRLITDMVSDAPLVANTPWGRALPLSGSGKVNISLEGRETAVFVNSEYSNEDCIRHYTKK